MADPARVKPEGTTERVVSNKEEQANTKSDETEDTSAPVKSTDENKDSSPQDKDRQEPKPVSCTTSNPTCFWLGKLQQTFIIVLLNNFNQQL